MDNAATTKAQMIDSIIGAAKSAAFLAGKQIDAGDLFFKLAFMSEKQLRAVIKKLPR
jgi:galactokinase/mevalonate kinase-like predicted kinase